MNEQHGEETGAAQTWPRVPTVKVVQADGASEVRTAAHHLDRDLATLVEAVTGGREATVGITVVLDGATAAERSPALAWSATVKNGISVSQAVEGLARRAGDDLTTLPALYAAGGTDENEETGK
ncbi:hypothetical protein ACIRPQ_29010 [Streptomyces sp. NPDC101213]|uniref:hypothetical protein n=1 Tax=Streptomyces sp. NPDC101213 TaxID=3366130 RepID=UPI00380AE4E5